MHPCQTETFLHARFCIFLAMENIWRVELCMLLECFYASACFGHLVWDRHSWFSVMQCAFFLLVSTLLSCLKIACLVNFCVTSIGLVCFWRPFWGEGGGSTQHMHWQPRKCFEAPVCCLLSCVFSIPLSLHMDISREWQQTNCPRFVMTMRHFLHCLNQLVICRSSVRKQILWLIVDSLHNVRNKFHFPEDGYV